MAINFDRLNEILGMDFSNLHPTENETQAQRQARLARVNHFVSLLRDFMAQFNIQGQSRPTPAEIQTFNNIMEQILARINAAERPFYEARYQDDPDSMEVRIAHNQIDDIKQLATRITFWEGNHMGQTAAQTRNSQALRRAMSYWDTIINPRVNPAALRRLQRELFPQDPVDVDEAFEEVRAPLDNAPRRQLDDAIVNDRRQLPRPQVSPEIARLLRMTREHERDGLFRREEPAPAQRGGVVDRRDGHLAQAAAAEQAPPAAQQPASAPVQEDERRQRRRHELPTDQEDNPAARREPPRRRDINDSDDESPDPNQDESSGPNQDESSDPNKGPQPPNI